MPTLVESREAVAVDVSCADDELTVVLEDGRSVSVPLVWFPRLLNATRKQRQEWEFIGGGVGIHWEEIDEDISISCGWPTPRCRRRFRRVRAVQRYARRAKDAPLGAADRDSTRAMNHAKD